MRPVLPEVRILARALLESGGGGLESDDAMDWARRALRRLAERLTPLVGVGGFHLLLQRSLIRARREHPWLDAIQLEEVSPWSLTGAAEAARGSEPEEVRSAAEALLAELIGLIARFLGADLAMQLVRESFPEASTGGDGDPGAGFEEIIHE
jgi:hypothetical protein